MDNRALLDGVDVRRFISFGIIKGIIYRVHRYAVTEPPPSHSGLQGNNRVRQHKAMPSRSEHQGGLHRARSKGSLTLDSFLDGLHCFDEICTVLQASEKTLIASLTSCGDVQIIHR